MCPMAHQGNALLGFQLVLAWVQRISNFWSSDDRLTRAIPFVILLQSSGGILSGDPLFWNSRTNIPKESVFQACKLRGKVLYFRVFVFGGPKIRSNRNHGDINISQFFFHSAPPLRISNGIPLRRVSIIGTVSMPYLLNYPNTLWLDVLHPLAIRLLAIISVELRSLIILPYSWVIMMAPYILVFSYIKWLYVLTRCGEIVGFGWYFS